GLVAMLLALSAGSAYPPSVCDRQVTWPSSIPVGHVTPVATEAARDKRPDDRRAIGPCPTFALLPSPGYRPVPDTQPSPALQCHRGLRRQTIVQSLLADVFQGRLRAGAHLVTQELANRFGVSHTPIREALIALAGIGIIDLLPNRGAIVRRVSAHE